MRVYISCSFATFFVFLQASKLRKTNSYSQTTPLDHSEVCAPFRETQHSVKLKIQPIGSTATCYLSLAISFSNAYPHMPPPPTSKTMDTAILFRQKKMDRDRCDSLTSQKLCSDLGARTSFLDILAWNSSLAIMFSYAEFIIARCSSVQQGTRSALCTVTTAEKFRSSNGLDWFDKR